MRSKYFPCCTIFNFHLIIFDFPVFLEFTAFLNLDEHLRYSSSNSCGYHIIGLKIMYEKRKKPISLVFFQFSTIASTKTTLSIFQFFTWQKFFRFSVFVHIFRQLKITEFCFPIFWAKYLLSMTCIFHFKQLFLFSGVISWSATDQWMTWSSPVIWTSSIDEYFHLLISLFCVTITVFVQISIVICLHLIKPDHKFRNDCR